MPHHSQPLQTGVPLGGQAELLAELIRVVLFGVAVGNELFDAEKQIEQALNRLRVIHRLCGWRNLALVLVARLGWRCWCLS